MKPQAFVVRSVSAALLGMLALVGLIHGEQDPSQPAHAVAAAGATAAPRQVGAQMPIVTLPTISVRPTPEEIAAAQLDVRDLDSGTMKVAASAGKHAPAASVERSGSAGFRLDMPYYSFGTALRRVSKD